METQLHEVQSSRRSRLLRAIVRVTAAAAVVVMLGVIAACKPPAAFSLFGKAAQKKGLQRSAAALQWTAGETLRTAERMQQAVEKWKRIDETKANFIDYVQNMDTEYMFEEYYDIDVALAHDFRMPVVAEHAHQELMSLDKLDADTVYALVVRNNERYEPPEMPQLYWVRKETFYDIEEPLLRKFAAIVCEVVNDALASDPRIDRESLLCRVANLKILFSDTTNYNGKLTKDGTIILYPESIDMNTEQSFEGRDMYAFYFRHELEHLFHLFCEDERVEGLTKGGVGIDFDSDELNPLFWNWFYEGSAEKTAMNSMHAEASTYFFNVAYIDSMTFSFLPDPNVSCTTLERIHRPREQKLFFDLFANLEQDEVIKMMYALDLRMADTYDVEIILDRAADASGTNVTKKTFTGHLRAGALETMSKNLYLNLLYGIDGKDVELDEVLHIIRLWEYDINSHIAYNTEDQAEYNEDFMERYSDMQIEFFQYLGARFDLTPSELEALLLAYDARVPREIPWLDEEKNQFLVFLAGKNEKHMSKTDGSLRKPIRFYNDILEERRAKAAAAA